MKMIFIVLGETGENEQHRSWLVKAFPTEKDALSFIENLESAYHTFADEDEELDKESEDQLIDSMRELDENFEFDPETGTEYSITECPFEAGSKRPKDGRKPPKR
ncbi:MAG: hypothetical protein ACXWC9_08965 [Pseudobdellovibrionaceae bacterium]